MLTAHRVPSFETATTENGGSDGCVNVSGIGTLKRTTGGAAGCGFRNHAAVALAATIASVPIAIAAQRPTDKRVAGAVATAAEPPVGSASALAISTRTSAISW